MQLQFHEPSIKIISSKLCVAVQKKPQHCTVSFLPMPLNYLLSSNIRGQFIWSYNGLPKYKGYEQLSVNWESSDLLQGLHLPIPLILQWQRPSCYLPRIWFQAFAEETELLPTSHYWPCLSVAKIKKKKINKSIFLPISVLGGLEESQFLDYQRLPQVTEGGQVGWGWGGYTLEWGSLSYYSWLLFMHQTIVTIYFNK